MAQQVENAKRFIREVKVEMAKVTWPSMPELKGSTILVIIVSAFFAVYVGVVDLLLSFVRQLWI